MRRSSLIFISFIAVIIAAIFFTPLFFMNKSDEAVKDLSPVIVRLQPRQEVKAIVAPESTYLIVAVDSTISEVEIYNTFHNGDSASIEYDAETSVLTIRQPEENVAGICVKLPAPTLSIVSGIGRKGFIQLEEINVPSLVISPLADNTIIKRSSLGSLIIGGGNSSDDCDLTIEKCNIDFMVSAAASSSISLDIDHSKIGNIQYSPLSVCD